MNSETVFFATGATSDIRNQNILNNDRIVEHVLSVNYTTPISDSLSIAFDLTYRHESIDSRLNTFDFDGSGFNLFNNILSNQFSSTDERVNGLVMMRLRKSKIRGSIGVGMQSIANVNQGLYLDDLYFDKRNYVFPKLNAYLSKSFTDSKSFYINANYDVNVPRANQLLEIVNLSNPLNTTTGNLDLKPTENFNFYLGYNNYDYSSRSGLYFWGGANIARNSIVSFVTYDEDFKAVSSFENIDLNYSTWVGGNWSKAFSKEKNKYRVAFGINTAYSFNQGFINSVLFQSRGIRVSPRVNFSWTIEDFIVINPSYNFTYNKSNYTNYIIESIDNVFHQANVVTTFYFPKNFVIGNDIGYNYNSNIADGFRKDFYLWNMSLGYEFFKKQMTAKVKIYDLLNQNLLT